MAGLCIMSTSYDRLRNTQTPHWYCLTLPMLHHSYLHPHSLIQGGISPNPGFTRVISSGPCCQPISHTPPVLHTPLLRNTWWRCVVPNEFLVNSLPFGWYSRSFWKNYSDICMCHGYKAPGSYPPTWLGFPCQPALCLHCPSSSPLRRSFLKLLNMANCARRGAHFIWIFWLGGRFALHRGRIKQGCLEKGESAIRYTGLCSITFFLGIIFHSVNVAPFCEVYCFLMELISFMTEF